jgi:hypothetical protein
MKAVQYNGGALVLCESTKERENKEIFVIKEDVWIGICDALFSVLVL